MKKILRSLSLFLLLLPSALYAGANFTVRTPGGAFAYTINSVGNNPKLTLTRGQTYTFDINVDGIHPFQIVDKNFISYDEGVQNNNISNGTLTFTVPMTAPKELGYICSLHGFGGTIEVVGGPTSDFNVSTPGGVFDYTINGITGNPTVTLTRGMTYIFDVDATSDHPFGIISNTNTYEFYDEGIINNNPSQGRIIFTVPTNAPSTLYYICTVHLSFGGTINIVDPAPPPAPMVKIISITVGANIVTVKSLGTNGWSAIPEFSSNLLSASWTVVPSFTNTFANGTNTTTFNRLDPICGPNVFLRVKNTGD